MLYNSSKLDNFKNSLSKKDDLYKEIENLKRENYVYHCENITDISNQYKNIIKYYNELETNQYEELKDYLYFSLFLY